MIGFEVEKFPYIAQLLSSIVLPFIKNLKVKLILYNRISTEK